MSSVGNHGDVFRPVASVGDVASIFPAAAESETQRLGDVWTSAFTPITHANFALLTWRCNTAQPSNMNSADVTRDSIGAATWRLNQCATIKY